MKCEECKGDLSTPVFLPAKNQDGSLSRIVCEKCALTSTSYCEKHKVPHVGYDSDGTTACAWCIEEMVEENISRAMESRIYTAFHEKLSLDQITKLSNWANEVSYLTKVNKEVCILKAIVTNVLRSNTTVDAIVNRIISTNSVGLIVPKSL